MGGSLPGSAHHLLTMVMRLSVDVHPAPWLLLDVYLGFRDLERHESLGLRVVRNMPDSCCQITRGYCFTKCWARAMPYCSMEQRSDIRFATAYT